jgi:hypothetical protein
VTDAADNPGPFSLSAQEAMGLLRLHAALPGDALEADALGALGRFHADLWLTIEEAATQQAAVSEAIGNGAPKPKRRPRASVLTTRQ